MLQNVEGQTPFFTSVFRKKHQPNTWWHKLIVQLPGLRGIAKMTSTILRKPRQKPMAWKATLVAGAQHGVEANSISTKRQRWHGHPWKHRESPDRPSWLTEAFTQQEDKRLYSLVDHQATTKQRMTSNRSMKSPQNIAQQKQIITKSKTTTPKKKPSPPKHSSLPKTKKLISPSFKSSKAICHSLHFSHALIAALHAITSRSFARARSRPVAGAV